MKRKLICMLCGGLLLAALPGLSTAATEAEKRAAIDAGLAWLASTQNAGGYWPAGGTDYKLASTGAALLSFLEEKDNWGANTAAYQSVVDRGLDYLIASAKVVPISNQPAGNPDADGNTVGVKFYPGTTGSRDTYVTGLVLPAIASSGTPNKVVTVGPLAARTDGSGAGGAWTYRDVVQNTIDYFAYGQNDIEDGVHRGGWRYWANSNNSDQSTTQWPVISSLYANAMGVSAPAFVSSELSHWTDYIQNPAGYAGYSSPTSPFGEVNETGSLLIQQAFLGWGTGDPRVQSALNYIDDHWQETPSGYDGNFGHPYAMWAVYKGLELMIGLDDMTTITNLHPDPGDVDNPDHGWNWWEDYCEFLVNNQVTVGDNAGSWYGYSSWNMWLATPWYINILAATQIPTPPEPPERPIPEPGTMLLLGAGLLGLCAVRQRLRSD
jgi:hypothetical protein